MTAPNGTGRKRPTGRGGKTDRRTLLRSAVLGTGIVAAALAGLVPIVQKLRNRIRPPGAIPEQKFLAACIKCGQCVQVCPVQAIKLADVDDGFGLGVPYIDARAQACDFSCDAIQCVLACPTGALSHDISRKEQTSIGFARLAAPDRCLALHGKGVSGPARPAPFAGLLRYEEIDRWTPLPVAEHPYDLDLCDLCVRECPIEGAISLEPVSDDPADPRRRPTVHDTCVGCGVCEMMCPAEPAAIVVDPEVVLESRA